MGKGEKDIDCGEGSRGVEGEEKQGRGGKIMRTRKRDDDPR
jgi:hypothetical protein